MNVVYDKFKEEKTHSSAKRRRLMVESVVCRTKLKLYIYIYMTTTRLRKTLVRES